MELETSNKMSPEGIRQLCAARKNLSILQVGDSEPPK